LRKGSDRNLKIALPYRQLTNARELTNFPMRCERLYLVNLHLGQRDIQWIALS